MKSIGPYVMARVSSGEGATAQPLGGAARPLWATDRLTGIPVLLQPLAGALDALPALPAHPALLAPSDLLSLPGEGEFVVTELPLQAVPATDARLAARGALQALDALHRRGLVHGQVSAAHLWSVDGQVRLSGAGLPTTATPTDDLRALALALDALGGLPAGLEVLRSAPETLSAGEALRRLSWAVSQAAQDREGPSPQRPGPDAAVPAGEPGIPMVVAPLAEVSPSVAAPAPLTAQVFDLGPSTVGPSTALPVARPPEAPEAVAELATTEMPTGVPDPAMGPVSDPAAHAPTGGSGEGVIIAAAAAPVVLSVSTPTPPNSTVLPNSTAPTFSAPAPSSRRGAGALARQRLRADAARTEERAAALEVGPAAATGAADPPASDPAAVAPSTPEAPGQSVTPQERRRRMRAAAEAEAQAQAAAPPLTPPARPPSLGPEPERRAAAPRRELRPMRLRWNEAAGAASGGGWQRRAGATDAVPGRAAGEPVGRGAALGSGLARWRWPLLAAALLVVLLGAVWAWAQGRARPQATAGAACCSVQFELSGAPPASGVRLTLAQAPAGAGLQPGAALGTVPGTVRLPAAGTYRVRVAAAGFTPETVSVTVPVSAPVRIELGR